MLRITESSENGTVRLRLDGTLTAASCSELETACSRHQADNVCSPFIETLLETVEK